MKYAAIELAHETSPISRPSPYRLNAELRIKSIMRSCGLCGAVAGRYREHSVAEEFCVLGFVRSTPHNLLSFLRGI